MCKSTLKILPTLMVAITGLMAQPVFGVPITHQLDIIENSSTNLTVTYDGSSVTPTPGSADNWTIPAPAEFHPNEPLYQWMEPGSSSQVNILSTMGSVFAIQSDAPPITDFGTPLGNGDSIVIGFVIGAGGASENVFASFTDNGDIAGVPDTGTTFSLLGFSLTGLAFLRRKLC
jgi:VPDSG-CTERM motif